MMISRTFGGVIHPVVPASHKNNSHNTLQDSVNRAIIIKRLHTHHILIHSINQPSPLITIRIATDMKMHKTMKIQFDMKDESNLQSLKNRYADKVLSSDELSVDSAASQKWSQPYEPAPVVDQSTILMAGFVVFVLTAIWPPLILLVAYIASKLIPYSFRTNDDPATRRRLFAEFAREDDLPDEFKHTPDNVKVEHGYWTNKRYVLRAQHRQPTVFALPTTRQNETKPRHILSAHNLEFFFAEECYYIRLPFCPKRSKSRQWYAFAMDTRIRYPS